VTWRGERALTAARQRAQAHPMRWLTSFGLLIGCLSIGCGDSIVIESSVPCGASMCAGDEYCCDSSCGLCVEQNVACTETCP
jgi:hypothetical protein